MNIFIILDINTFSHLESYLEIDKKMFQDVMDPRSIVRYVLKGINELINK